MIKYWLLANKIQIIMGVKEDDTQLTKKGQVLFAGIFFTTLSVFVLIIVMNRLHVQIEVILKLSLLLLAPFSCIVLLLGDTLRRFQSSTQKEYSLSRRSPILMMASCVLVELVYFII